MHGPLLLQFRFPLNSVATYDSTKKLSCAYICIIVYYKVSTLLPVLQSHAITTLAAATLVHVIGKVPLSVMSGITCIHGN